MPNVYTTDFRPCRRLPPHLLRRLRSSVFPPCPEARFVPWRLRAPQDRACGGDTIQAAEEAVEEGELSERGGVRSRKWKVTTHPQKVSAKWRGEAIKPAMERPEIGMLD